MRASRASRSCFRFSSENSAAWAWASWQLRVAAAASDS
eukprot:CAMPEP_0204423520 /NCGR_PEP_ID=MMETSP0470-20130426/42012_1 /ASSEMBLY_ACC=CAM_ASM_000385 /TAXON_ID=2969 /ORGANISM="Oxyrrhis marina" /LENGTH=37 /DNA_ID= /DNA_START= /DNA_END= /DNA_ORIENTATION=